MIVQKTDQLGGIMMPMQLADRLSASKIMVRQLNKLPYRFGLPISAEGSFLGFAKVIKKLVQ